MTVEKQPLNLVTVKTTLPKVPYPPVESRPHIRTDRLLLRPYRESDDEEMFRVIRSQPDIMIWTARGTVDESIESTRDFIKKRLSPHDATNYDFIICLASTGEMIGVGGSHLRSGEMGWPVLGYMLRKDAWGKGYGTEFLKAFLEAWWQLPREVLEVEVDESAVEDAEDADLKKEAIAGITVQENASSQNVLRKGGMELVKIWEEENMHPEGGAIDLYGFVAFRPAV
jgi:RimJ/RimL family protein N-acetyltransferase